MGDIGRIPVKIGSMFDVKCILQIQIAHSARTRDDNVLVGFVTRYVHQRIQSPRDINKPDLIVYYYYYIWRASVIMQNTRHSIVTNVQGLSPECTVTI